MIVIAPDPYKESLTAMEVANAIEAGFRQVLPDAEYHKLPMADCGEKHSGNADGGKAVTSS